MREVFRGLSGDLQLALRSLGATRAVTVAALLTLALAIGITTAIFSVFNGLVLRPLPVADPQRLATITSATALRHGFQAGAGWNYEMWDALRQRAGAFDGAFAWTLQRFDLSEGGEMQPVQALIASGDIFNTLGIRAEIGRTFTAADDVRGGGPDGPVAVISYHAWHRRFKGAPDVVGSRLSVEGTPLTIVGVAPQRFRGLDIGQPFDLAMPFGAEALVRGRRSIMDSRRSLTLTVMLRLKREQTLDQATAALKTIQPEIVGRDAPQLLQEPFLLVPASRGISDRTRLRQQYAYPLVLLLFLSAIVLVIACMNIGNLFLVRAVARRGEWAIRVAVGAPRFRLARQMLIEALTVASIGALTGTLLAIWTSRALIARLPDPGVAASIDLAIDGRVLAFTAGLATLAAALFGTGPAMYAARTAPMQVMQDQMRGAGGKRTGLFASGLVMTQVAASVVLLAASGLFVRTINRLADVPLGFDPQGVIVMTVDAPSARPAAAAAGWLYERILERIFAMPGVTRASASIWIPVGPGGGVLTDARGRRADLGRVVAYNFVTPGWFATYGMTIHAGRDFDVRDGAAGPRVAVVNETLRRSLLPDRDPIGATVTAGPCARTGCTVVGIVGDAVYGRSLRDAPPPTLFMPLAQSTGLTLPDSPLRISIRESGDPERLRADLATTLRSVDPALRFSLKPLNRDIEASMAEERLTAELAACFGGIALILSAVGLYGVTSHSIARRRGEIGIRLAMGGQPGNVLRSMLAAIATFVLAGMLAGVLAAVWLSRFVTPLLYQLEPRDPVSIGAATLILGIVAAVAAWIPARQATRLDPAQVLREN